MIQTFDPSTPEREKYQTIWSGIPEYKDYSPGLENVARFMSVIEPESGQTLLDIGCGAGVAGLAFAEHGLEVWYTDITDAGLNPDVPRERFIQTSLWSPLDLHQYTDRFDYGFCVDVMEHIPPEYTMLVLDRVIARSKLAWIQVSNIDDVFGKTINMPLHLTVQPFVWWRDRIGSLGILKEARDLCGTSLFVVERR